jgi:hypothetical protein
MARKIGMGINLKLEKQKAIFHLSSDICHWNKRPGTEDRRSETKDQSPANILTAGGIISPVQLMTNDKWQMANGKWQMESLCCLQPAQSA